MPPPPHPLRIRPAIDLPVIAVSGAIALGTELVGREQPWAGCGACDPSLINGLDRRVIGNASPRIALASDVLLGVAVGAPVLADLADAMISGRAAPRHAAAGWAKDALVLLETAAVNVALTNLVKFAVRRPRPYSYDPDSILADPTENDARLSFYSGHASLAFAMATAYGYIFTVRHPRSRALAPVWLASMGIAATTALLRVEAGKHFWTDILAGALAGSAVGLLVPVLHRAPNRNLSASVGPTPRGALLTVHGRF